MKEKLVFEEVFNQVIRQPNFWLKLLIGGSLSFIPFVNIFAFGYLYRFSAKVRLTGNSGLPEWNDWSGLFADGLKFGVIWIIYWLLPMLLAVMFSVFFASLGFGAFAYLFVALVFAMVSILFCSALYRFHIHSDFKALLNITLVARMSFIGRNHLILPVLVFSGICALALPFYGIAFFLGFLLLIVQTSLCFRLFESRK